MKANFGFIKLTLALVMVGLLYGFTNQRNEVRKLKSVHVEFTDENSPFITLSAVNKLLIQNNDSVTSIAKETLVLKEMESRLLKHPMVRDAQVFVTVNGELRAKIEQRMPIGRVAGSPHYYVDEDGDKMLLKLRKDEFMNQSVVGMHQNRDGTVELRMRKMDFKVHFGKVKDIDKKFQNYKAFYKKAKKDKTLTAYNLVNLQFGNQVVAIKK